MNAHVTAHGPIAESALEQVFLTGRSYAAFKDIDVPEALLREAVKLTLDGPTAVNSLPVRITFVRTPEAKEKLKAALSAGNIEKTMAAPVTAIVAYDLEFYEHLPHLFAHMPLRDHFAGNPDAAREMAFRNGSLQAGYFILALRSLGLDAGPMSGFDNAAVDAAFFPEGNVKSNILVNIGYGDAAQLFPRAPRLTVDQVAAFV